MTDKRAKKLARALFEWEFALCISALCPDLVMHWERAEERLTEDAAAALAAVDADPETYGYRKIKPPQTLNLSDRDRANILRYHGDETTTAGAP